MRRTRLSGRPTAGTPTPSAATSACPAGGVSQSKHTHKGIPMRTKRTLINMAYTLGTSLLLLLLGLATRRLLVTNFGDGIAQATGVVEKLFNFFSIAEFGVGSVISYRLYEQIAAKDEEKISLYMSMYKWAYRAVGLLICLLALAGAALLPWIMPGADMQAAYTVYGLNA